MKAFFCRPFSRGSSLEDAVRMLVGEIDAISAWCDDNDMAGPRRVTRDKQFGFGISFTIDDPAAAALFRLRWGKDGWELVE